MGGKLLIIHYTLLIIIVSLKNFRGSVSFSGILYLIATPIGNLDDISCRVINTLKNCDKLFVEDTRVFKKLAKGFGIDTPAESYYEHNELEQIPSIIEALKTGAEIGLVSDAGTPLISDPGYKLVRECRKNNIRVSAIPGAFAGVIALSISGFETDSFAFFGFLPHKPGKKEKALIRALESPMASIFYESPHRIKKTLKMLKDLEPDREVFIARELTKMHEETIYGKAKAVWEELEKRSSIKGELVFILRRKGGIRVCKEL